MIWETVRQEVAELVDLAEKLAAFDHALMGQRGEAARPSPEALRRRAEMEQRYAELKARYT